MRKIVIPQHRSAHAPVAFDELLWQEDLEREGDPGAQVARSYRERFELHGQRIDDLQQTRQDGPVALPASAKVYLPDANGRWSMIFEFARDPQTGRHYLAYVAFGQRHPPSWSPKWTVYELAYYRLHGRAPRRPGR